MSEKYIDVRNVFIDEDTAQFLLTYIFCNFKEKLNPSVNKLYTLKIYMDKIQKKKQSIAPWILFKCPINDIPLYIAQEDKEELNACLFRLSNPTIKFSESIKKQELKRWKIENFRKSPYIYAMTLP